MYTFVTQLPMASQNSVGYVKTLSIKMQMTNVYNKSENCLLFIVFNWFPISICKIKPIEDILVTTSQCIRLFWLFMAM